MGLLDLFRSRSKPKKNISKCEHDFAAWAEDLRNPKISYDEVDRRVKERFYWVDKDRKSKLITCPACGRPGISPRGVCPDCHLPLEDYLSKKRNFVDPSEGDMFTCPSCGEAFKLGRLYNCPHCGDPLDLRRLSGNYRRSTNPECPKCHSRRVDCFNSCLKIEGEEHSRSDPKGYWCHNCGAVFDC